MTGSVGRLIWLSRVSAFVTCSTERARGGSPQGTCHRVEDWLLLPSAALNRPGLLSHFGRAESAKWVCYRNGIALTDDLVDAHTGDFFSCYEEDPDKQETALDGILQTTTKDVIVLCGPPCTNLSSAQMCGKQGLSEDVDSPLVVEPPGSNWT